MRGLLPRRRLDELLRCFRTLRVAVVGDFFLDSYYDCDARLDEASLETGRKCYQVVRTRRQAGAAGTVAANLVALGVGSVSAVGFCGQDGEGWELRRAMEGLGLQLEGFTTAAECFTPTYGKPCYVDSDGRGWRVREELERIDIKNRRPTPRVLQESIAAALDAGMSRWHAIVVVDQVSEAACGVVTARIRRHLRELRRRRPQTLFLVDSRHRIDRFAGLPIKPNHHEAAAALGTRPARSIATAVAQAQRLSGRDRRPVFLTLSARGMVACVDGEAQHIPGFPVIDRPVDPVGAGDSTTAALVCCLAAGATPLEAALVANLVGSITVQQIGTTGTATPTQVRRRWKEIAHGDSQSYDGEVT
ncbi:MAG: PfkB family carbohydrate kinase [Candidatus Latescibacterota bacterium]